MCQNKAFFDDSFRIFIHSFTHSLTYSFIEKNATNFFEPIPSVNFDPHLSFLVDSREIIIMPMTNAYGYYKKTYSLLQMTFIYSRTEAGIDVNRDFPFDLLNPPFKCFMSETSQAIQVLFNHNMIVSTITFHGGMQSISYEWGDFYNRDKKAKAPDMYAMKDIAESMGKYCGN